ncbi:MAG: secondary thiamine-phosphate synthase enzyme YjbQ [Anaeromyxobacteraceae bacterium]
MKLPPFEVRTPAPTALVEITDEVRAAVRASGVRAGLAVVFVPHTTAGVTIQENADPDVKHDLLLALENAVPRAAARGRYRHGEGNSDAHVKASLVGSSVSLLVRDGDLALGTWQGIQLCEFDGPRTRSVWLEVIPG